jgi:electron transfer flavoprotein alpha subunit
MTVLVFVEHHGGTLAPGSLGVLGKARELASVLGTDTAAVIAGSGIGGAASSLATYGVGKVYAADDARFEHPTAGPLVDVLAAAIPAAGASVLVASASVLAAEVCGALAARLGVGINTDGVDLVARDGKPVFVRPALDDSTYVDCGWTGDANGFVGVGLMRAGSFTPATSNGASADVVALDVADSGRRVQEYGGSEQAKATGVDITQADVLVGGGRGLGGPENFHLVEELAKALGGEVATTRAVVDAGWYDYATQVGQTGKTVQPKLYIAVGISGAIQHKVGMQNAGTIVAINKDPNAPIFEFADFGVVGDLFQVLPKLEEKLKERKG